MSKQGKPIAVIGSSNMDLVAKTPKIPVIVYGMRVVRIWY